MQQTSVSLTILTLLILCVGGAGQHRRQDPCLPSRLVPCSPQSTQSLRLQTCYRKGGVCWTGHGELLSGQVWCSSPAKH